MAKASTPTGVKKATKAEATKLAAATKANLEKPADEHIINDEQRVADRHADEQVKADVKADVMSQFVDQQTKPPVDMAAFQAEMEALKSKFGVVADVVVKPTKPSKNQQNGVTRPGEHTECGKIWATADAISLKVHGVCPVSLLKEHPDMKAVNDHTLKTQFAKWRKFNNITGRLQKIHAVHQEAGEYPGMQPL